MVWLKRLSAAIWLRKIQLGLAIRITVATVSSFAVATAFHLALPLWAVLTSLVVTQLSVGRSLKATRDYMFGTIGGAIYGGAIAVLIPHSGELQLLGLLVLTVAPLAFAAAINPSLNTATVTAIIVLLVPLVNHSSPLDSAIDRVAEVTVGAVAGLLVSFIVLPSRAHRQIRAVAARAIDSIASALSELLSALMRGLDKDALHQIQDGIGSALVNLNAIGAEAERERAAHLTSGPDTGPLLRTILRLRHDLVMIGRASGAALPSELQARLAPSLTKVRDVFVAYLHSMAAALRSGAGAPAIWPVHEALQFYAAEIASVRSEGLLRGQPGDVMERIFALGFALEQMRQNLKDLERCIAEWSNTSAVAPGPLKDQESTG